MASLSNPPLKLLVAILLIFGFAFGPSAFAQSPQAADVPPANALGQNAPNIMIGPGDMLNIVVFDTPELTTSVRVSQDGNVNLPVLGLIKLAGLSTSDAATLLQNELRSRNLIIDPHVTIFVSEYASQGATVMGEVRNPSVYPTLGSRKLLDMISVAGGVLTTAGKIATIIHRDDPQHPINIALQSGPATMYAQQNPVIQPGDTIVVAKAGVVYVVGDVIKPGGFLIDNNTPISVLQSLTLAGGWDKTAALSKMKLIRKTDQGREEVDLDLKHVTFGSQADVAVKDGDIIFVPSSMSKTLAYRGLEAAIALTTAVVYYIH